MWLNSWLMGLRRRSGNRGCRTAFRGLRVSRRSTPAIVEFLESRRVLSGTTITVDILGDTDVAGHTTLRDAITAANADAGGDTIQFAGGLTGTITLQHGYLPITNAMSIVGPGADKLTISGNNQSAIFLVGSNTYPKYAVVITGLTLTAVNSNLGGLTNYEMLTLSNDVLSNNTSAFGAGVVNEPGATLTSTHNVFLGNTTVGAGGAGVYNAGTMTSTGDAFTDNTAGTGSADGGAIYSYGTLTITNDTFSNNAVSSSNALYGNGGAVFNSGIMTSSNSSYMSNTCSIGGGICNFGTLTSTHDLFSGNTASGTSMINSSVAGGGGILNNGSMTIANDTFSGNQASRGGGVFDNTGSLLTSINTTFTGNHSDGGGGLFNAQSSTISSTNDTFSGNTTSQGGGGVLNIGTMTMTNDTFCGNTAVGGGGGILNGATATSQNCTFSGNHALSGGGIYNNTTWYSLNSIVVGNIGGDFGGIVTSLGGNLIGLPTGKTLADVLQTVPNTNPSTPRLANNGGPTQTIALANGSPGIGHAVALGVTSSAIPSSNLSTLISISTTLYVPVGQLLRIDNEIVLVTAYATSSSVYVNRAQDGTTAAAHAFDAPFYLGSDQTGAPRINSDQGAIAEINHAPIGTSNTLTAYQNVPYAFQAADFGFTDPNDSPSNSLMAVKFTALPNAGTIKDNGVPVTANQFVSIADINGGKLTFTPTVNLARGTYFVAKFQVEDNGGTANGGMNLDLTAKVLSLNLMTANHAPAGTTGTVSTGQNIAYIFKASDFGFTDPNDTPANSLLAVKFTVLPNAGTITDNGVPVTANQFVSATDISSGKLVFTPTANLLGTYFLAKFQVEDNGGTGGGGVNLDPTPKVLSVNIVHVNHAPVGTSGTVTAAKNTPYVFKKSDFGFTDPGDTPPNNFLMVKFTLLPNAGTLKVNGVPVTVNQFVSAADISTGKLTFTPTTNFIGTYFLAKFQVEDDGGTANGGANLDPTAKVLGIKLG